VLPSLTLNRVGWPASARTPDPINPYPVDAVISSGTATTKEVFEIAGVFDEALFIDLVDVEWCLRCRSKGIVIRVIPSAVMSHRIGSRSIAIGPFTVIEHSPVRCYYQLRNCFHFLHKKHVPLPYAVTHMLSVIFSRTVLLFLVGDRPAYVSAYLSAVRDGIKGVTGAKPA